MSASSDSAELSSLGSALAELAERVVALAERYGKTPDSVISSDLFEAERYLASARRALTRAVASLGSD
ncbi:MAG: hypothetical protein ACRDV9_11990 [Acidimicrobiia bacterium]